MDQIFISHRFTFEENGMRFTDALYLPEAEYKALTPQQIEAMKQERFTNWKARIAEKPKELTYDEKLAQVIAEKKSLEEQLVSVTARETELKAVEVVVGEVEVVEGGK